jgi:hypothetical protein
VGGQKVAVTEAGPHSDVAGVGRVIAGKGDVEVVMTVGGRRANRVKVAIR